MSVVGKAETGRDSRLPPDQLIPDSSESDSPSVAGPRGSSRLGRRSGRAGAVTAIGTVATRVGGMLLVVWGAATLAFLVLRLVPGDPVDVMLGVQGQVNPAVKAGIRADLGLDQPVLVQYFEYLGRLLRGDLGRSYQLRQPVIEVIGQQLGSTIQLTTLAVAIAVVVAVAGATLVTGRRSRAVVSLVELVGISAPPFWTGLVLLTVFAFGLRWFPVAGAQSFAALILPAITIAIPVAGILGQVLRTGIQEAEGKPFITTAIARGARPSRLVVRHSLRHATVPALTLTGYILGSLFGGAVIVETVFARPGLGRVTLAAITDRDLPVVMGIIVLTAVVFVVINLIVDLVIELVDPRLGAGKAVTGGRR